MSSHRRRRRSKVVPRQSYILARQDGIRRIATQHVRGSASIRLYFELAVHSGWNWGYVQMPVVSDLAERLGVAERTIQRGIAMLTAAELVSIRDGRYRMSAAIMFRGQSPWSPGSCSWVYLHEYGMRTIARDRALKGSDLRVLLYLIGVMRRRNTVMPNFAEVGRALGADRQMVWQAFRRLRARHYLRAAPRDGRHCRAIISPDLVTR